MVQTQCPQVPDIDKEITTLTRTEAYDRVENGLDESGLQIVFFESGMGEWREYYRENPDGDGVLFWSPGHAVQVEPERGDLLRRIGKDVFQGDESLQDVFLVPMKRMPEWGDGTVHYSCKVCYRPIRAEDRVFESGSWYHSQCSPMLTD